MHYHNYCKTRKKAQKPWSREVVWLLARVPRWEFSVPGRSGRAGRSQNHPKRWLAISKVGASLLIITWKRGLLFTISAKMVPIDQMSMGQEYLGEPRSTSGALKNRDIQHHDSFIFLTNFTCTTAWPPRVCSSSLGFRKPWVSTNSIAQREKLIEHLANPKSAILIAPFLSIKRFWGLRSLQLSLD